MKRFLEKWCDPVEWRRYRRQQREIRQAIRAVRSALGPGIEVTPPPVIRPAFRCRKCRGELAAFIKPVSTLPPTTIAQCAQCQHTQHSVDS